jgi:lambda repressor-like predicted transcriptional regulator
MTTPAALVQADLTPARHKHVRLELSQGQHRLGPVEIAALVAAYEAGRSLAALSREFKLHKRTVHAHLVRAGVDLRPQQVLTSAQVVEVIKLYRLGATLKQLGPQYGVANASIRNYLTAKASSCGRQSGGLAWPRETRSVSDVAGTVVDYGERGVLGVVAASPADHAVQPPAGHFAGDGRATYPPRPRLALPRR